MFAFFRLQAFAASIFAILSTTTVAAEVGVPAPNCQLSLLTGSGPTDIASRLGKVLYVDFWASWCGPCAQSFPFMHDLQAELGGQDFEVLAVSLDETREDALAFLDKHPSKVTLAHDETGHCPEQYRVEGMPQSYLVDRRGQIRYTHLGFKNSDREAIKERVKALLAEPKS